MLNIPCKIFPPPWQYWPSPELLLHFFLFYSFCFRLISFSPLSHPYCIQDNLKQNSLGKVQQKSENSSLRQCTTFGIFKNDLLCCHGSTALRRSFFFLRFLITSVFYYFTETDSMISQNPQNFLHLKLFFFAFPRCFIRYCFRSVKIREPVRYYFRPI